MKVKIGPYLNWWGAYQIADLLKYVGVSEETCFKLGEKLSETWVQSVCEWIYSKRTIRVRIDNYDHWNASNTAALILLPLFTRLKANKHGSPCVDFEDVPEFMRTSTTEYYDPQEAFDFYNIPDEPKMGYDLHDRWDWVMTEILWALEQMNSEEELETDYNDPIWLDKHKNVRQESITV